MRKLLLLLILLGGALLSAGAHAQAIGPAGPPTEAQFQQAQKQRLLEAINGTGMSYRGMTAGPVNPGAPSNDPNAIAIPDASQAIPSTANPQKLSTSIQIMLLLSLLTLAPSILLMMTCFTRIVIVMSLLRQALGAAQLPPNQILIGLSLFMTFLVMGPTWNRINNEAIKPYTSEDPKVQITQAEAFNRAHAILRVFMINQVVGAHNEDDVLLFYAYAHPSSPEPKNWEDVETTALVPGFILSELKIAFLMGFRIYLPFLIIDMVISSVLISIGMQLLPPVMVSLPFKLLLFVLVDGWHLVCGTLMASFNTG
ncbi:MAG TPA: flagellar type III secretion system pore protein FliP [Phycisphaerae bacterium]|nr:flagellar type III secretion system pore protein FliP [Phycisphaerae bacterium]